MASAVNYDSERRILLWRALVSWGSLAIAAIALASVWLHAKRAHQVPGIELQGSDLVSATLLRSELDRSYRNGETVFHADFSVRNASRAPVGVRVASKSCSCNHVTVVGRNLEADEVTIDPYDSATVRVSVPFPSSSGSSEHEVILASTARPSHIPLRIQLRLLDDFELRPSIVEAKLIESGMFAAHFEIIARVRSNAVVRPAKTVAVKLARDKPEATLSVHEISRNGDTGPFRTYRLNAVLGVGSSVLTHKYNHFELLGFYDEVPIAHRSIAVVQNTSDGED